MNLIALFIPPLLGMLYIERYIKTPIVIYNIVKWPTLLLAYASLAYATL